MLLWAGNAIVICVRYPFILITGLVSCLGFRVLNRTSLKGRENCRLKPGMFIVSNHQSLPDSFSVGANVYIPQVFLRPNLLPWHLADRKNFFTKRYLRPFMKLWKGIPVGQVSSGERRDQQAFQQARQILKDGGTIHVFLEGKRSPTQEILPPDKRVGGLILLTKASVRPVYFTGMHQVHPYRKRPGDPPKTWLRVFGKYFEWYFDLKFGHQIKMAVGDEIKPAEIQQWADGELDLKKRSALVAERLRQKLLELRSQALS